MKKIFTNFAVGNKDYMEKIYRPRVVDSLLSLKLEGKGAVVIEGAKWCGKTTTAEQAAKSIIYMSETGKSQQNQQLARLNPKLLLRGEKPRLIDEWQVAPELWDSIRFEVDHASGPGQFILTGSAVPADMSRVVHSGTGRFGWLRMRPMALWESGDSSGEVSLEAMFKGKEMVEGQSSIDLQRLAFLCCRGGWPSSLGMREVVALEQPFDYLQAVAERDLTAADGVERDPVFIRRVLRTYARHIGASAPYSSFRADLISNEGSSLTEESIGAYIKALKRIFVVEDMGAWNPNLRSQTAIRTADTRYFTDPSLATAALGLGPDDLIGDLATFGLVFESLCVRDLRVYAEALNGEVLHYRDKNGLECDAVVHLRNGAYGLIEIKLGGDNLIEQGAASLKRLASKIDTTRMKGPSFLMVLTGVGNYAYPRADGVWVVPIGCLKP